jgi:dihydrofolate reductase
MLQIKAQKPQSKITPVLSCPYLLYLRSFADIWFGKKHIHFSKIITLRKLKLQVQMTLDGFVGGPEGQLDWMWLNGKPDEPFDRKIIELADSCDTILLGRKMTPGFIEHWENIFDNDPDKPEQSLAQRMVNMRKIVFSRTQTDIKGRNLEVENGDLASAVQALKKKPGKDIIVYGGANFVSSLVSLNLIDEFYIFRHPVAIGKGLSIFNDQKVLNLDSSLAYKNGRILNKYLPV